MIACAENVWNTHPTDQIKHTGKQVKKVFVGYKQAYPQPRIIDAVAGEPIPAGGRVYLTRKLADTGLSFGNPHNISLSDTGDRIFKYYTDSSMYTFCGSDIVVCTLDEEGRFTETDTRFSFPGAPPIPSGYFLQKSMNASPQTDRYACYFTNCELTKYRSPTYDLVGWLIVDKETETSVSGSVRTEREIITDKYSAWNANQPVAMARGDSEYLAVLLRQHNLTHDKAVLINIHTGEYQVLTTPKIIDDGATERQNFSRNFRYYCLGRDEIVYTCYNAGNTRVLVKRLRLSDGDLSVLIDYDVGDRYSGELLFLDDSRIGILNYSRASFDIFNAAGELAERIENNLGISITYAVEPSFHRPTNCAAYAMNESYVLLVDIGAKQITRLTYIRRLSHCKLSQKYVAAYANPTSTKYEYYLYRFVEEKAYVRNGTPPPNCVQGYVTTAAQTGDSIRVVVTYDPAEE